jgi:hypothetical protein
VRRRAPASDIERADVQDLADTPTGEGLSASTVQNTLDPAVGLRLLCGAEAWGAACAALERRRPARSRARVIHVQRGWDAVEGEQDGKSAAADRRVPILELLAPEIAAHKLRTRGDGDALVFGRTATGGRREACSTQGGRVKARANLGPVVY